MTVVADYETLFDAQSEDSISAAQQILASGWKSVNYPNLDLRGPIPWTFEAETERVWNFRLHSFAMLKDLLAAHTQTQELRYLQPALRIAQD